MRTQSVQGNNYNPQFGMAVHLKKSNASPLRTMVEGFVKEINADPANKGLHATLETVNTTLLASGTKFEGFKGATLGKFFGRYTGRFVPTEVTGNVYKGEATTTKEAILNTLRANA